MQLNKEEVDLLKEMSWLQFFWLLGKMALFAISLILVSMLLDFYIVK